MLSSQKGRVQGRAATVDKRRLAVTYSVLPFAAPLAAPEFPALFSSFALFGEGRVRPKGSLAGSRHAVMPRTAHRCRAHGERGEERRKRSYKAYCAFVWCSGARLFLARLKDFPLRPLFSYPTFFFFFSVIFSTLGLAVFGQDS